MFRAKASAIALDFGEHAVKVVQLAVRDTRLSLQDARSVEISTDSGSDRRARVIAAAREALRTGKFRGNQAITALRLADVTTRHIRVPQAHLEDPGPFLQNEVQDQPGDGRQIQFCAIPVTELRERDEQRRE